ncbi:DUF2812 domain-containing protein [Salisediminibacterium beveridgei]|uniref:DUF2812 domain-containing protein n=1 Tax=Salisediminibacterium beveridgei TaxID=632773 RepID=A0A1D7QV94_9BACI|nr:DUF2812 domain-containing protein [Salisediminibacterium beveridgei]AOM82931.1 hypothetical protein BBEV_1570 [Salisediminibacterium beveridgei]
MNITQSITRRRYLWSLHIHRTEKWLEAMAANGYHLQNFKGLLNGFQFHHGSPASGAFRIVYQKAFALPRAMKDDGWYTAASKGNWHVLRHDDFTAGESTDVVRDELIQRNNRIRTGWHIFFALVITSVFFQLSLFTVLFTSSNTVDVTVHTSPFWLITILFGLIQLGILILGLYSLFRIKEENHALARDMRYLTQEQADALDAAKSNHHATVRKWRPAWMSSPDRTEKWLEKYAEKGLILQKVTWAGIRFHFVQDSTTHAAYHVHFERTASPAFETVHYEAGWHPLFRTKSHTLKWTVFMQTYDPDRVAKPVFDTDPESIRRSARDLAFTRSALLGFLISLQFLTLWRTVNRLFRDAWTFQTMDMVLLTTALGLIILLLVDIIRCWRYYFRVRSDAS